MTAPTENRAPVRRAGGLASKFALIVAVVLVVALVTFVLQNTVHTNINFIGWHFDLAQGFSLLGAAVVGAAIRLRRAIR